VIEYLKKSEVITDSQHSFSMGRSCLSNLLSFLTKFPMGWIQITGTVIDVIYLDFVKAFDKFHMSVCYAN